MNRYFFFTFVILTSAVAFAQFQGRFSNGMKQDGGNFSDIQARANAYFVANPDTTEGGLQKEFERWEWFWSTRVNSSDSSINGTFIPALNALSSLMQTPVCTSSPYVASWNSLGPNSFPDQAEGMVLAVTFDPVNPLTTFYAGTPNSGAWKTTDGGTTWQSLTESLHLPGMGVNDIKIEPTNNNVIYIATGMTRLGSYGIGVLKSTDGGVTWNSTGLTFTPSQSSVGVTNRLLIDPTNTNIVYALADDKIYKTTDGGVTWPSIFQLQKSTAFPGNTTPCNDRYSCMVKKEIKALQKENEELKKVLKKINFILKK